jgi:hypothetical protein
MTTLLNNTTQNKVEPVILEVGILTDNECPATKLLIKGGQLGSKR